MHPFFILLTLTSVWAQVHIKNVPVLTLHANTTTTSRRLNLVPKLQCVGPACWDTKVDSMRCTNLGFNGTDVTWSCKTNLNKRVTLGKVTVSCEGYETPNDPFILEGSCGAVYELNYVPKCKRDNDIVVMTWFNDHTGTTVTTYTIPSQFVTMILLLLFTSGITIVLFGCIPSLKPVIHTNPLYEPSYYDNDFLYDSETHSELHDASTTLR